MIRYKNLIIILVASYVFSPAFAVAQRSAYFFLKEPAVKWNDQRLTGKVENAPVKALIMELLRMEGSDWEVIGDLSGTINISFNHLTIDESIKKIMRISRYNYALILEEQEPADSENSDHIKELTIYRDDQRIRFSRTSKLTPAVGKKKTKKVLRARGHGSGHTLPSKSAARKVKINKSRKSEFPKQQITQPNKKLKAFADEMLGEGKITQEEYKEFMRQIEAEIM